MIWYNKEPLFFIFNHFLDARAEIRDLGVFLGELKTPQFSSEISWSLKKMKQLWKMSWMKIR